MNDSLNSKGWEPCFLFGVYRIRYRSFMTEHGFAWRTQTNVRKDTPEESIAKMDRWIIQFREVALQPVVGIPPPGYEFCAAFGRFSVARRFNMDQVPLQFVMEGKKRTWAGRVERQQNFIKCAAPHAGLCKRQATLQLCLSARASGPHPRPAVIFRGKGEKLLAREKEMWAEGVAVFFQKSAWMDLTTLQAWHTEVMTPFLQQNFPNQETMTTCDNLEAQ
eukprot:9937140-Lingulodinium_polyedra.AAC.1